LFIETPYRTAAMFAAIVQTCSSSTRLALAIDLTGAAEYIMTRTIGDWRTQAPPPLERLPAIFSLLA